MKSKQFSLGVVAILLTPLLSSIVLAAPVEQRAVGDTYQQGPTSTYSQPSNQGSSDPLWDILNQVQMLQTEVLELRGTIDQQAYEIQQIKMQQKQHYVDLDQRIESLGDSGRTVKTSRSRASSSLEPANPEEVKAQYQEALKSVKSRDYDQAQQQLESILNTSADSFYAPFAHYWLAEVLLAQKKPDIKSAQQHFERVISEHSGHSKVPPSMYKLGTIYHVNGSPQKAKDILKQLMNDFPGSSEAGMASHYLDQM